MQFFAFDIAIKTIIYTIAHGSWVLLHAVILSFLNYISVPYVVGHLIIL